jgi:hypothetical protein
VIVRTRRVVIGGAAALALLAGGTAAAATTSPSTPVDSAGVIHGCWTNNDVAGRMSSLCKTLEPPAPRAAPPSNGTRKAHKDRRARKVQQELTVPMAHRASKVVRACRDCLVPEQR